ncbi:MAG: hypothetical protein H6825_15220 [Planctomycetes bacterium]|nr:hypothetical protein [Planctomycetota bacterium]
MTSAQTILAVLTGCALLTGCITFSDTDGVDFSADDVAAIEIGTSTRRDVLERLGPPTGVFRTRIFDAFLDEAAFAPPSTAGRVDDDVLVWQQVRLEGTLLLFPVLVTWANARVAARTLMVVFDEHDRVTDVSFREDDE